MKQKERVLSSGVSLWENTGRLLGHAALWMCPAYNTLLLSLWIFFSVIRLAVFPGLPPWRLGSYFSQMLEPGVLSPSMLSLHFKEMICRSLRNTIPVAKLTRGWENIYVQLRGTERIYNSNLLKKMWNKFYKKGGQGPMVRKKSVWGLVKLRGMLMTSWSSTSLETLPTPCSAH